jgi:GPI ethanolamine phosphate transferase 1
MIAGFYEDLSAVTKGWKANPVEFDSSFHRAESVYCWGSPDIVYLFNNEMKGSEHINSTSYDAEIEDFGIEGSHLDTWVFQRFQETIERSYRDSKLWNSLHQSKSIFFLHLLGIDTNGHAHRPYATEYLNNIKVVDSGVEQAYYMIENYFNDSKTAYIFTSDHGMSDIGNHGDGDPANTQTPLIVWGSGVVRASFF